jgi:hypothetical protein
MKLLNSSSSHGWVRRFLSGWEREREREIWAERERERERLFIAGCRNGK